MARSFRGGQSVLEIVPSSRDSEAIGAARLEHAFALRDQLPTEGVARPLALEGSAGRRALVVDDPGGEILATQVGAAWPTAAVLRVGIGVARALRHLHDRGLVHCDIKPAHLIVELDGGGAWLTGFGIASRSQGPRVSGEAEVIAGTFPYMSPEQTGRVGRGVDCRSDLYSLGVVLYQLATGALPFTATDAASWIHRHIAGTPAPFDERRVPAQLARIVMKLLAKSADDRYQTARGLEVDLTRCLRAWEESAAIPSFALAASDIPDRLGVPGRLYGRDQALAELQTAFERARAGAGPVLALVGGYSGIGKSRLVAELGNSVGPAGALLATGKFDEHKRDIPYATLTQAFTGVVEWILSRPEQELSTWRSRILGALGHNGQLVCAVIPQLERIIGKQPPVAELSAQDARTRFQHTFTSFVAVLSGDQPLVLFVDDLQWLDAATLEFLEFLLARAEPSRLLVVGAYRDNELDEAHPLRLRLGDLQKAANGPSLLLRPLELEHVAHLVAASLSVSLPVALPLAELVQDRAQGNPFFILQFLTALVEERLLIFDHERGQWRWELSRIAAKGYSDNVVDLMLDKLARLGEDAQAVLKMLACLGTGAPLSMLAAVGETSVAALDEALMEARRFGLVLRTEVAYELSHDRVREAAYASISAEERPELHLRVGRRLLAYFGDAAREEAVFELVSQLNRGSPRMESAAERESAAELNLLAARRARSAMAYASAQSYVKQARALLGPERWERRRELAFALELLGAECEFLTGNLVAAEEELSALLPRAESLVERAEVTCLSIDLFTVCDRSDRGVDAGLGFLRSVGVEWQRHPTRAALLEEYATFHRNLGSRAIEELASLGLMTDRVGRATMDVLTKLQVPALFFDENLHGMVLGRMANLSLTHGNSDGSSFAYCWLAGFVGPHLGDYPNAPRLARLGLELAGQPGLDRFKARVYCVFGYLVTPWIAPLRSGYEPLERAREMARSGGDLTFVAYTQNHLVTLGLGAGEPLPALERDAERGLEFCARARFGLVSDFFRSQLMLIRALRYGPREGEDSSLELERRLEGDPRLSIAACWHWIRKLQAHYHEQAYPLAAIAIERARTRLWTSTSSFENAEYQLFAALTRVALAEEATASERALCLTAVRGHLEQLTIWAQHCPSNFRHRAELVQGELARVEGRITEAEQHYEAAIQAAREQGFAHHEGLCYELAARFYAARGFAEFARLYRHKARDCYGRWGADALVLGLARSDPAPPESTPLPPATVGVSLDQLDLATVVAALQAVSSEIDTEALIEQLMRRAAQHAVADRALLVLDAGQPRVHASARMNASGLTLTLLHREATGSELPMSVLSYVLRTGERIVLGDGQADPRFATDPYVLERRARSILCVPIVLQGQTLGALYLENGSVAHAFSPRGLAVLDLLASQAAISLENARLYAELRRTKIYMGHGEVLSKTGTFSWRPLEGELFWSDEMFRIYETQGPPSLALFEQRVHPEDRDKLGELFAGSAGDGRSTLEQRLIMPGGAIKHLSTIVHRVAASAGRGEEYVGTVRDVTDMKRAEETLQRSQAALADVTRVASLAEMAAAIAHEVNQPLAAISLNASTSLRWLSGERPNLAEGREAIARITRDATRGAEVIKRLRQLFKGFGGERAALDVNQAIREVSALMQSQGRAQGVTLVLDLSPELPSISGDRVQLQQVVMNLILNAVEATREVTGRPAEVRVVTSRAPSGGVHLDVIDNGVGLRPEELGRIFEAFYTTKAQGMGIGLSMSKTIVESHGGTLGARANEGSGTTLSVWLPATST